MGFRLFDKTGAIVGIELCDLGFERGVDVRLLHQSLEGGEHEANVQSWGPIVNDNIRTDFSSVRFDIRVINLSVEFDLQ